MGWGGGGRERREEKTQKEAGHLGSRAAVEMPGSDNHPVCQTRLITHRVSSEAVDPSLEGREGSTERVFSIYFVPWRGF